MNYPEAWLSTPKSKKVGIHVNNSRYARFPATDEKQRAAISIYPYSFTATSCGREFADRIAVLCFYRHRGYSQLLNKGVYGVFMFYAYPLFYRISLAKVQVIYS
jgi:hypothetical protein